MLRLVYSDQSERLLEGLLDGLGVGDRDPFEPTEIVVPNANLEAWVRHGVAEARGVAANLRFWRLERFASRFVEEFEERRFRLVDLEITEGALLHVLHDRDRLNAPPFERVRRYLSGPGGPEAADLRRTQLAARTARLFEEYAYHRPEMLARWRKGELVEPGDADEEWQSSLWREILGDEGILRESGPVRRDGEPRWVLLSEVLARHHREVPTESRPLHVFGLSYVGRVYQDLFRLLRERRPVHLYSLNPCLEFWEDVESPRELRNRLRRERGALRVDPESLKEEEDPFELLKLEPDDTPLLRLWGSPGRESHRLLNQLSDCDYEGRFSDPGEEPETLLRALQLDILRREPRRRRPPPEPVWDDDDSLRIAGCASVRREVEVVADEIWHRIRSSSGPPESPPLRFHEIAVVVNHPARDEYLPHLEAVFREIHDIPISLGDLPLPGHSRIVDAALRLLELPFGRFDRREMLKLLNHPAVTGSFDDLSPEDWPELTEE
ncbi:MAG: exodeoxyribonuclease V subunit gamma, partial [Thermoanaerobaculia bacterium]|nr:exodeoxyribonuclease V subunit gamma [Thermoanaerobaculia bacterium]